MPSLQQIKESTVPVTFMCGQPIQCQCYALRISWKNPHYAALAKTADDLQTERGDLISKLGIQVLAFHAAREAFEDPEYLKAKFSDAPPVEAPAQDAPKKRAKKGESESLLPSTTDQAERITTELGAATTNLTNSKNEYEKALDEVDGRIFRNTCERVALLLCSWDLTEDDEKMVATDANTLEQTFEAMPEPLSQLLNSLEGCAFGFLATPPATTG